MAPEILNKNLDISIFQHFVSADVYCFSLVIWEVVNCLVLKNVYSQPYYDKVGHNPSIEMMNRVVNFQGVRPEFLEGEDEFGLGRNSTVDLQAIYQLCRKMWSFDINERPAIAAVKLMLDELKKSIDA